MGKTSGEKMELRIFDTADGSSSIYNETLNETYHSRHGAIQESKHVFIEQGFRPFENRADLHILEVGFGTGLNALLTLAESSGKSRIVYSSLETCPLPESIYSRLIFDLGRGNNDRQDLLKIHEASWDIRVEISPHFLLEKKRCALQNFETKENSIDVVYFDAFGPEVQPEMWVEEVFRSLYNYMRPGAFLVTYCAKGQVRRNMIESGFEVARLSGPPGKREMLRAKKPMVIS